MTTQTIKQATAEKVDWSLSAVIRIDEDGPEITRESVTDADLADIKSEAWMEQCLRRGHPEISLEELRIDLVPIFKKGAGNKLAGLALYVYLPENEEPLRSEFTIHALQQAGERGAERLQRSGTLKFGDNYYYEIQAKPRPGTVATASTAEELFTVTAKHPPLAYATVALPPLLAKAKTIGTIDDRMNHVFYTEDAWAKAERFARKGGDRSPPVETGAALIGYLCSCPESGEFFTVVVDALEAVDAEQTKFSLNYSDKSWSRIQTVVRARQSQPATRAQRMVGQCHGHNFLPAEGAPPCEMCSKVAVCTRTSVFVSSDDRDWSRAVFARQPWQLCHIFGLNARSEKVHALYGLRDGRLQERGFHIIPDFKP
jgi:hypothetical protein